MRGEMECEGTHLWVTLMGLSSQLVGNLMLTMLFGKFMLEKILLTLGRFLLDRLLGRALGRFMLKSTLRRMMLGGC